MMMVMILCSKDDHDDVLWSKINTMMIMMSFELDQHDMMMMSFDT